MARGKYQKKEKMTQTENKSNGKDFIPPEVKTEVKQREFYYLDLQIKEVPFINHLVQGYFDEIQAHKHYQSLGMKFNRHTTPIPAFIGPDRLEKHIFNMQQHMVVNSFNTHKIYAAYLRKPQFPLSLNNTDDIPVAYIWFYLSMDIHGDNFMAIEQLFTMPDYDKYISIIMYHFGIPGVAIWLFHIIVGLVVAFIGYQILNNKPVPQFIAIIFIVLGSLAVVYHSHIWYLYASGKEEEMTH